VNDSEIKSNPWARLETIAVAALVVTVLCVFIGETAQQYAAQNAPAATETAQARPRFNAIDYAQTGAIKTGTVIIGPCDDKGR